MENFVIHISGASGSGKTTLGNKLKEHFKGKIVVKDLDNLRSEFEKKRYSNTYNLEEFDSDGYQAFLDQYILSIKKPLILVGLNHMFWFNKDLYYNVHSTYNFYIDVDDMLIVKQKCIRFLTDELPDMVTKNESIIRDITEENPKFVRLIKENIERECGTKETLKLNRMWKKDYKKQGYTFMSREDIYKSIVTILNKTLPRKKTQKKRK